jgi:hypothetical protein
MGLDKEVEDCDRAIQSLAKKASLIHRIFNRFLKADER